VEETKAVPTFDLMVVMVVNASDAVTASRSRRAQDRDIMMSSGDSGRRRRRRRRLWCITHLVERRRYVSSVFI